ncbi:MlaC/ttg2D family ABC transporter substrate-binding protein [Arhodomonas sp. AD133]|uniref:MlaC/ttg2D family ABC transporter substrate-binding protein n=1 Tax=Arhodomonas sp. AD133 TaxID=3415009 RepID=UPI003EBAE272
MMLPSPIRTLVLAVLLAIAGTATATESPVAMVRDVMREGLAEIAAQREAIGRDPAIARGLIERYLLPHTDSRRMGRLVAGAHWRNGTDSERRRFTRAFTNYLIHSYAAGISEYVDRIAEFARNGRIDYRRLDDDHRRTSIRATLQPDGGPAINVDLYLHHLDDRWQVYDVRAVGVSLLLAYRESLRPRFDASGMSGVSAYLEQRIDASRSAGHTARNE